MATTLGNGSVIFGDNTFLTSANGKTFTAFTATGTYTVPTGVTSVRVYAFGGGGNGGGGIINTTTYGSGGGGGGCAYGNLTVTPGGTISVTIDVSKNVVVSVSGTNHFYANCGVSSTNGAFGGNGGTAAISGSVTNGGAYAGGQGGNATAGTSRYAAGGGGAGSPLGIGGKGYYDNVASGVPASGGGVEYDPATPSILYQIYSGAGSATAGFYFGGTSGGSGSSGASRSVINRYTDPLLQYCNGNPVSGKFTNDSTNTDLKAAYVAPSGPGCGGSFSVNLSTSGSYMFAYGGAGGDFGGGGPAVSKSSSATGGFGGFGGGGGGAYTMVNSSCAGGNGGYGGGGGGGVRLTTAGTGGTGGPAIVLIYA